MNASIWPATRMLAWREWTRFFRQRNRVSAAVLQPIVFWVLFGAGLSGSFASASGQSFAEFFLPGTVAMIVLFTAIFSTISVIEDRREGFMQAVLVSPAGRLPVLLGKVVGGAAIAWVQAVAFMLLALAVGTLTWSAHLPLSLLMLAVIAIAMCALGMIVAWPMSSTQGFHAIMMLGLMPMWLLAGTFFPIAAWSISGPVDGGSWGGWVMSGIMRANPLSYAVAELRRLMNPAGTLAAAEFSPSPAICWAVSLIATAVVFGMAWRLIRGSRSVDTLV